jgi:indolepyruvate ferredoxin oxidoreductase
VPGSHVLTEAVARGLFKLMAYKDEYEVARLYTSGEFLRQVQAQFEGKVRLHVHLAPPLWAGKDAQGRLRKRAYGPWVFPAFRLLAKLRGLRGTWLDPFGYQRERREERALIGEYRRTVEGLLARLAPANVALAAQIAGLPEHIRGYGHVKDASLARARTRLADLLAQWQAA